MYEIDIHLYQDWLGTVRQIFVGSGQPLPAEASDKQVGLAYYIQNASDLEEAEQLRAANEERLQQMEQTIRDNLERVIVPDIRQRTGYEGHQFCFRWVYSQGEHIVEEHSQYRISL